MTTAPHEHERPLVNITGEMVALGPLRRDLLPLYVRWINDFVVTRTLSLGQQPVTWEAETGWYDRASAAGDRTVSFTIYERATVRPIGVTDLRDIDHRQGTAEFGIMIGARDCWGKGYGGETAALMLSYGFHALGLHNIMLQVFSGNERGIRAYRRAGFREIGRRRQAFRLGGQLQDVIYMDCLATEFAGPMPPEFLSDA